MSDDRDIIGNAAVDFFSNLFNGYSSPPNLNEFDTFEKVISEIDNVTLVCIPDEDEIWGTVCAMNRDSAPGPDGFTGHFYVACWDIIKHDLTAAVQCFFQGQQLPTSFSATHLFLLPKVNNATSINQLRPISLCNFSHKIISHILLKRLATWLPLIISEEQTGFIPGRSMHENIALAHDLIHDLENKVAGGNVIIKLDMAKAYDKVSWTFLLRAMRSFGFSEQWCDLIFRCISNYFYSVKWEGELYGFFRSTRGVRQGDPLSPSLFVIVMEWLSKAINRAASSSDIRPYHTLCRAIKVNHLLFADDILIFTNGAVDSLQRLLTTIDKFCSLSGEELNPLKSVIIFAESMDVAARTAALNATGFLEGSLPLTYLGAPLFRGRNLMAHFHYLEDRVRDRIHGWARNFLSMGGRVTLVNAVLNAIGIHVMMVLPVPKGVLDRIISLLSSFVWDNRGEKRKHWIGWERLCCARTYGGLGIRDPHSIMLALHGKLAWSYVQGTSLWARHARSRFNVGQSGSPLWNAISHLIPTVRAMGTWRIGNGDTNADRICHNLGVKAPSNLKREKLRHIMNNEGQRWALLHALPLAERLIFENVCFIDREDKFVWKHSSDGLFSTKIFFESFQTRYGVVGWGKLIWKPWIPTKVSCFIWKVFHKVVPTDDTIKRLGIAIVSKCVCCSSPSVETSHHILFSGQWARNIWRRLASIFHRPPAYGLNSLQQFWLTRRKRNYMDDLAATMACCAIWEIWKARNTYLHEDRTRDIWEACCLWASKLSALIKSPYIDSPAHNQSLAALRVHPPQASHRASWWPAWQPPDNGYKLNIAFLLRDGVMSLSGLIRDSVGRFVVAIVHASRPSIPLQLLDSFLNIIHETMILHHLPIRFIQSSHPCLEMLHVHEDEVPGDMLYRRRAIRNKWPGVLFHRIIPARNHAAIALVCTTPVGTYRHLSAIHRAARQAITADRVGLHSNSEDPFHFPTTSQDDSHARHPHQVSTSAIHDDSHIVYDICDNTAL